MGKCFTIQQILQAYYERYAANEFPLVKKTDLKKDQGRLEPEVKRQLEKDFQTACKMFLPEQYWMHMYKAMRGEESLYNNFTDDEMEFIIELLRRYRNESMWKRCLNHVNYVKRRNKSEKENKKENTRRYHNGFSDLFMKEDKFNVINKNDKSVDINESLFRDELADELYWVLNGMINFFTSRMEDENKKLLCIWELEGYNDIRYTINKYSCLGEWCVSNIDSESTDDAEGV